MDFKYRAYLLFGAPGSGKGTQGRVIGSIPGFVHLSCGEVLRSLDLRTDAGKAFWNYSSMGKLVPDDIIYDIWTHQIDNLITLGRFKPEIDHLVLDGIPRNLDQARMLENYLNVKKVFYLHCPDQQKLVERLRKRALRENRIDDASDEIILKRLQSYETETAPVLDFYGKGRVVTIDSLKYPYQVLLEILSHIHTDD